MYQVEENRILYLEDGTTDYVFRCFQPSADFRELSSHVFLNRSFLEKKSLKETGKKLSETKKEELIWQEYVTTIVPRIEKGENLYLSGTFPKKIYDHVRAYYKEKGWYDVTLGTYSPDRIQPGISLTVDIVDLVYKPSRISHAYLSQGAVRSTIAALNDGIISRIYIRPEDENELVNYFTQSHLQLKQIARAITSSWKNIPEVCDTFTLRVPSPSWTEALCE